MQWRQTYASTELAIVWRLSTALYVIYHHRPWRFSLVCCARPRLCYVLYSWSLPWSLSMLSETHKGEIFPLNKLFWECYFNLKLSLNYFLIPSDHLSVYSSSDRSWASQMTITILCRGILDYCNRLLFCNFTGFFFQKFSIVLSRTVLS